VKTSNVIVVLASLLGAISTGGEAFASYVVAHRHTARAPEPLTVEREAKPASSLHYFESIAEADPERADERKPAHVPVTWSGNGKKIAFDRDAAAASLRPILEMLGVCRVQGTTRGEGTATVAFMATGQVLFVKLDAPYKDTVVGACVQRRLSHAETPLFDDEPQTVRVRFSL
jgi:hypothetical protein